MRVLVVLAVLAGLGPLATDLYLPVFPAMTEDLGVDALTIQLSLTAFLVGSATGQLFFGPLSDRVGRFWPLVAGLLVCIGASAVAALAPSAAVLIVARLLQGFGSSAGLVIGRAIIADLVTGLEAARALNIVLTIAGIAPIIAPLAGSLLAGPFGWRGILLVLTALSFLALIGVLAIVRETHTSRRVERPNAAERRSARRDLLSRGFVGNSVAYVFGFSVLMAYVAASPFLYQDLLGYSTIQYGLLFGANAVGVRIVSLVANRLSGRWSLRSQLLLGLSASIAASLSALIVAAGVAPLSFIPIPIFVAISCLGLVFGSSTALALQAAPRTSGTASALLGTAQFGLAAVVTPLVSLGHQANPVLVAVIAASCGFIALAGRLAATPPRAADHHPQNPPALDSVS